MILNPTKFIYLFTAVFFLLVYNTQTFSQNELKIIELRKLLSQPNITDSTFVFYATNASRYYSYRNIDSAKYFLRLSINRCASKKCPPFTQAEILAEKAHLKIYMADADSGLYYLRKAYNLVDPYPDNKFKFIHHLNLAIAYATNKKNDSAIYILNNVINNPNAMQFADIKEAVLHNIAISYQAIGDFETALNYFIQAADLMREKADTVNLAILKGSIGDVLEVMGDHNKSYEYKINSIELLKTSNNIYQIGRMLNNIAAHYSTQGDYDQARKYFTEFFSEVDSARLPSIHLKATYNYAIMLLKEGSLNQARPIFQKVYNKSVKNNIGIGINYALSGLAKLELEAKNYQKAKNYLTQFENYPYYKSDPKLVLEFLELKTKYFESQNQYKEAMQSFKKLHQFADSLEQIKNKDLIIELERKYEFEAQAKENEKLKNAQAQKEAEIAIRKKEAYILYVIIAAIIGILINYFIAFTKRKKLIKVISDKNQELESINKQQIKILRTVSHDLRNQTLGIIGLASIIKEEKLQPAEVKEFNKLILESSEAGLNLITGILEKKEGEFLVYELKHFVDRMVLIYQPEFNKKNLVVKVKISSKLFVNYDQNVMRRIFQNLISNAIKFNKPNGSITISVKILDDEKLLVLTISDTGEGFSDQELLQVFNRNTMFKRQGSDAANSHGIGLSIVKELVENDLQGTITLKSEKNKGATFEISLPY